jgi:hypothetical protein
LNQRLPAPEAGALPGCATPRQSIILKSYQEKVKENKTLALAEGLHPRKFFNEKRSLVRWRFYGKVSYLGIMGWNDFPIETWLSKSGFRQD